MGTVEARRGEEEEMSESISTDALSKLRDLERDLRSNKYAAFGSISYEGQLEIADRIKAILPALEQRERGIESATIMRFRKMLDRIGIHGYYNEMMKEFGDEPQLRAALNPTEQKRDK
jgi:hypothetical protein